MYLLSLHLWSPFLSLHLWSPFNSHIESKRLVNKFPISSISYFLNFLSFACVEEILKIKWYFFVMYHYLERFNTVNFSDISVN